MTIEVQKPNDENPDQKDKGRLYVCDLAGTEPAGDIYYAVYKDAIDSDGNVEHVDHGAPFSPARFPVQLFHFASRDLFSVCDRLSWHFSLARFP